MRTLVTELIKLNLTISTMESLTGGLFGAKITSYSGVSKIYKGTLVTYSNQAKIKVGHVDQNIINKYGAISEETAIVMAKNCQNIFETDIAVSFTGNAGPTVMENKAVGLVYSVIRIKDKNYLFCDHLSKSRNKIRNDIVNKTIVRLLQILGNEVIV